MKTTHCILCLLIILLLISCTNIGRYRPVANKGSLDLSEWDFNSDGTIGLNGTWEFYRDRLYTPQDFKNDSLDARPYYLNVPGVWNSLGVSGEGYGTYRLKIRLNHQYQNLGIKILDISSAYKIWINDSLVGSNGNVTASSIDFTPQMHPQVESFLVGSDQIQIVVQVANYFHHKGGIWEMIRIGTEEQIIELREKNLVFTMFFAGTVLIFFIYHIWIYLFRKNEKAALWFGLLCLVVLIRTLLINERAIYSIFPAFSLKFAYKTEYITMFCLIPFFFSFYYYSLFEIKKLKAVLYMVCIISLVTFFIILFSSAAFYTSLVIPFQIVLYSIFVFYFILTFSQIAQNKKGAWLFLLSGVVVLLSGINDILYLNLVTHSTQVSHFAFFIFLLAQAYILSSKIAAAYNAIEDLTFNLERKVALRTHELEVEKKKSDNLLLNILPEEVARELKQNNRTTVKTYSMVTVMFTDFKDFTKVSEKVSAELLVEEIDHCFSAFDEIIQNYGIEKIKTVGDAYICASGLPALNYTHAVDMVSAAIEIRDFISLRKTEKEKNNEIPFDMRIGIHTGPVVAGIVGTKKFAYDIWGDTVNIAARMESSGEAGKVNISGTTYELVKDKFTCTYRGKVQAKNKGEIDMYFVDL